MSEQVKENKPTGPFSLFHNKYKTFVQYEDPSGHKRYSKGLASRNLFFVGYLLEWLNELWAEREESSE